ncbi:MAG: SRPBCC domain-containing protein [Chitinophagaceae bacterium]
MATTSSATQHGNASTVKKTFSRETSVSIEIKADPSIIWKLLTNASDYPRWNSTIILIDGSIASGEKIKLKSTLDPKRTFKLKVKELQPESKLVWGDALGNRVYTLNKNGNGSVLFSMTEKIGGPIFPLFAKMIPSFDKSFEQFAADLKKEAESIMNTK